MTPSLLRWFLTLFACANLAGGADPRPQRGVDSKDTTATTHANVLPAQADTFARAAGSEGVAAAAAATASAGAPATTPAAATSPPAAAATAPLALHVSAPLALPDLPSYVKEI